ncbi:MAG TPA: hypothetical protein LFW21_03050 [Rickettsia endosymbiont of Pyrocoelia pectoralis]|nr:hypothetical protein [Rickettsia endosymbiont of Pyrocoelia pectoralis]
MIKNIIIAISTLLLLNTTSFAADSTSSPKKDTEKTNDSIAQKIIDEFYNYARTIKPEVREEVKNYRIEIVNINKTKRELYNSLSSEAQSFLAKEQEYKQRLSISKTSDETDASKDAQDQEKK